MSDTETKAEGMTIRVLPDHAAAVNRSAAAVEVLAGVVKRADDDRRTHEWHPYHEAVFCMVQSLVEGGCPARDAVARAVEILDAVLVLPVKPFPPSLLTDEIDGTGPTLRGTE